MYVHKQRLAPGVQKSFGFCICWLGLLSVIADWSALFVSPPRCRDSLGFAAVGLALLDLAKGHALRLLLLLQMLLLVRLILSGPGLGEFLFVV